ncbi:AMP-binding protein [Pseudomonas nitroreducens]|uniref:AMP-binding acetyl-CoA synthetase n=1 Tax=Pseudomonas nitroreducens TaxID=46680 RepID=A0A246F8Y2_PSENT|nr:AMP-binding protein [Pseudomonas nitroreducens]OWP50098.1 AMP-binding acetyl-CoA synthetase [Pseudomonas nitroreducens]
MNEAQQEPTLLQRFLHWESQLPDTPYLHQPLGQGQVETLTWRQVGEQARRIAAYLVSLDLPTRSNIALFGKNSAHWIIADLAIWMAGHVSVPLYSSANRETVAYVLAHADVRLMFLGHLDGGMAGWQRVSEAVPAGLPIIELPLHGIGVGQPWNALLQAWEPLQQVARPRRADLATIVYTSGSTGQPKGVMHSFQGMCHACEVSVVMYDGGRGASPRDRLLSYLPLAHTAERAVVETLSLYHGCQVFFNESLETFASDLRWARPTIFMSVPRLWGKFFHGISERIPLATQQEAFADPQRGAAMRQQILAALGLDQVHTALSGSAPLPIAVLEWYRELGLDLLEGYGMSENFGCSHFSLQDTVRVGYVGAAIPGVECRIAEDGEILVRSPGQMLGYYRQPELTRDSYTDDGLLRTGDRGELDEEGRLRITGRVKELFKTAKGKYVAPVPIEVRLGDDGHIEGACVTGVGLAQPLALINVSPDTRAALADPERRVALEASLEAFLEATNQQLEAHERLACLVLVSEPWTVDNGLLTPTLKIRRNLIEERYQARLESWSSSRRAVIVE